MILKPFEKVILIFPMNIIKRGRVIGLKKDIAFIAPLGVNFQPLKNGNIIRLNVRDINKEVLIIKH